MSVDLSPWDLGTPEQVRQPDHGTNNEVLIIDGRHVLRIYRNLDEKRIEAELRLLDALRACDRVPFAVPRPIATATGERVVRSPGGPAVLFEYLPGRPARRTRLTEIEAVGAALGRLDAALAELPHQLAPVDWRTPLTELHPAVPDIDRLRAELRRALPDEPGIELLRECPTIDASYLQLTDQLPLQIIHCDLAMSNVLIDENGQVSAVLDFETAGLDLRVNDLVAGLTLAADWGTPTQVAQVQAFLRGFESEVDLHPAELSAVGLLAFRRMLGSVIWRAGRWQLGQADLDEVRTRLALLPHARVTSRKLEELWRARQ